MIGFRGATPSVSRLGKNTGYNQVNVPTLSPEQMQMFQQMVSSIMPGMQGGMEHLSQLAAGGTPEMWAELEAPAMRQFGELQGNLASRFSGQGAGARRSSGFANATTGAASQLAQQLQGQRMGLRNQAIQQLMQMSGQLLNTPLSQTGFLPQQKPWWQEALMNMMPGVGQGGSMGMMRMFGLM